MAPPSGVSAPAMRLNRVVLPDPFGPMMPTSSPAASVKLTSWTARTPPKPFETLSTSSRATGGVTGRSPLAEGGRRIGQRRRGKVLGPHELLLAVLPLRERGLHDAGAVRPELHGPDHRRHVRRRDRVTHL